MAYAGTAELASRLKLRGTITPEQTAALQLVLDMAASEIDSECGTSFGTPYPPLAVGVNIDRAVEHWAQQEAPFGIVETGAGPVVSARDSWDRHANKLAPLKQTWGAA